MAILEKVDKLQHAISWRGDIPIRSRYTAGIAGRRFYQDLAQGRVGVIDVGTYTTDYVLVDRLRYVEHGSGTISGAMSRAYQLIGRSLLDTFGLELLQ